MYVCRANRRQKIRQNLLFLQLFAAPDSLAARFPVYQSGYTRFRPVHRGRANSWPKISLQSESMISSTFRRAPLARRTLPGLPIWILALRRPRGAPSAGATCFARPLPRVRFYPSKNCSHFSSKKRTPLYPWPANVAKNAHQNRPPRPHFRRVRAIAVPCRAPTACRFFAPRVPCFRVRAIALSWRRRCSSRSGVNSGQS